MKSHRWLPLIALFCFLVRAVAMAAEPIVIAEATAQPFPQQPQMAMDHEGTIHLVYGAGNATFYTRLSNQNGATFTKAIQLPGAQVMALGMRRGPRIAVAKDSICVTVIGGKQGKGRDGDVIAFPSIDQGATWSAGVAVNDVAGSAREGLHAMAAAPDGTVVCVWLDLRNKRTELMSSVSTDGGKTWNKNSLVYRSPSGSICECCHPSLVSDAKGQFIAMWRNSVDGQRDMYYAVSKDGTSFGNAMKVGNESWTLDRCPMDGGSVGIAKDGSIQTVWRRDTILYSATAGSPETKLAIGEQPVLAISSKGTAIAWLTKRRADLMLRLPHGAAQKISSNAFDPAIVGSINSSRIGLAWETREGSTARIHFLEVQK